MVEFTYDISDGEVEIILEDGTRIETWVDIFEKGHIKINGITQDKDYGGNTAQN